MAINERLIDTEVAAAANGDGGVEQNLILHLDANDVDSYDGDGDIWYDISEHDVTIPLSDNADDLELHLNASDSTSYDPATDTTTWTDISGNSRNATLTGLTNTDYDIDNGGFFTLDGSSDFGTVSHNTSLDLSSGGFTVEAWVYHTDSNVNMILDKGTVTRGYGYNLQINANNLDLRIHATGGTGATIKIFGTETLTANEWNHVAFTVSDLSSSATAITYVNGVQDDTDSGSLTSYTNTSDLLIGSSAYNTSDKFDGKIGAIRIYSKALSPSEVGQNYRHGRDYIYTELIDDTNLGVHLDAGNTDSYDPSSDGSTWSDLTTSNADVTLTSMNADQHDKEIGGWFSFDGSADYGTITNDAVRVTTGGALTVEMWIRPSSISVSNKYFLGQSQNTNASYSYSVNQTNQTLRLLTYSHSGGFAYAVQLTTGNVLTQANKWYHFAFTLSDTIADNVIYINGENVKQATSNGIGTERGDTNQLQIGAINGGNNWQGDIGQVRIYQETLTADQVMQNYLFTKNDYPNEFHLTGTNMDSSDWSSSGYFDFATNEYFEASTSSILKAESTVIIWCSHDGGNSQMLFSNGTENDTGIFVGTSSTGEIRIGQTTAANDFTFDSTLKHYAFVFSVSDGNVKVYKNGDLQTTRSHSQAGFYYASDQSSWTTNFRIGRQLFTYGEYWDGKVGYVKVYDRTLSQSEIEADYDATKSTYE